MLENKKARLIVVSRDSYIPGEPSEAADLVTPVLRKVLDFIGIRDVDVVRAGGSLAVNLGKVRLEDHLAKYDAEIAARSEGVTSLIADRSSYLLQSPKPYFFQDPDLSKIQ